MTTNTDSPGILGRVASARAPIPSPMSFATMTDRGKVRRRNEDAAFALAHERLTALGNLSLGLFMVADGMGGQTAGDRASAIAIQTSSEFLLREIVFPLATLLENAQPSMPIQEAIERAFLVANNQVLREVSGGGATLTAALLIGQRVYVGHVGDCRLYLLRAGSLQLLTRDHSLLNRLIELGQMEAGPDYQPERDPRRNSLWQAMGQSEDPEVDIASHRLEPGDGLLLCCDGLWSAVSAESMAGIMLGAASPAAACQQLIGAANAAGGPDNITAIIVYPLGMPERLPTDSAAQAPDERRTDP